MPFVRLISADHRGSTSLPYRLEVPLEFKVFEIGPHSWSVKTISLANQLSFRSEYDQEKYNVQGWEMNEH